MAATVSSSAIEIDELSVFRDNTVAVDKISVNVEQTSWFGLIGANGSGKTSLLRALAGRLPCKFSGCKIDGEECSEDPEQRATRIGFMPPAEFLPNALTCRQIFDLVQPEGADWRAGITLITEAIGLDRLLVRRIGDCSAGMKQRIAIGCAFAANNAIVILDEPFNWLDPVAAYDLRIALRKRVDVGLTLITALHDMLNLVACDEGLLLGKGKIVARLDYQTICKGRTDPSSFETNIIALLRHNSQLA